jgi:F-type H+-transporting ATPase subunit alpha
VEKQILIIFAGTNAYLDDLPVEQCRKFEAELYRFVENAHRALLDEIRNKKTLDDDLKTRLKAVIEEFKGRFVKETPAASAHA